MENTIQNPSGRIDGMLQQVHQIIARINRKCE